MEQCPACLSMSEKPLSIDSCATCGWHGISKEVLDEAQQEMFDSLTEHRAQYILDLLESYDDEAVSALVAEHLKDHYAPIISTPRETKKEVS